MATLREFLQDNGTVAPGIIKSFGGTTVPTGWLACDGTAVSRTTYAALFAVIGTNFGNGNGSSTFTLPDFRGRFLRGQDQGTSRDTQSGSRTAIATGGNTGDNVGSLQSAANQEHEHSIRIGDNNTGTDGYGGLDPSGNATNTGNHTNWTFGTGTTQVASTFSNFNVSPSGNVAGVVNGVTYALIANSSGVVGDGRPKNVNVRFIIKT